MILVKQQHLIRDAPLEGRGFKRSRGRAGIAF
jgi:hypothetical protein